MQEVASERLKCMQVQGGIGRADGCFEVPGLDVWVWRGPQCEPDPCGGELHLLTSCASGRTTRMLLAEVSGHRPLFAHLAGKLRDLMRDNVNSVWHSRVVDAMHRQLREHSEVGGFATAVIATFFAPTGSLTLCNAGHPSPFVYRAESGRWSVLKELGDRSSTPSPPAPVPLDKRPVHREVGSAQQNLSECALGVVDRAEYQQIATRLDRGDMVLGYSNVLTECSNDQGRLLGMDGLLQRVQGIDPTRPTELIYRLSDILARDVSLARDADPLVSEQAATLLLCRATDRPVGWKNNLLAPLRLLGRVTDSTRWA